MEFQGGAFRKMTSYRQGVAVLFQVRFKWSRHLIAFWDNRCTDRYAVNDYGDHSRHMERVAIVGDRPFH